MPLSDTILSNKYDVPELMQPNKKAVISELSNLYRFVNGLISHKNKPTQKPVHIEQDNNSPKKPLFGLILSNIFP